MAYHLIRKLPKFSLKKECDSCSLAENCAVLSLI